MSAALHPPAAPEAGHGTRSEEDRVQTARLVVVGVAALVVFFLGSFVTVGYLRARQQAHGPQVIPPEVGLNKVGLVEQQQFVLMDRGQRAQARDLERLGSAGWVDRKAGIAHIPIDQAMELVVDGVRAAPVQGGAPPPGGQP